MTEKARKIFDILGVEPAEEFRIVNNGMLCRFNEELELQCRISDQYFETVENVDTYRKIITGETKIIKIPKPTEEDKIVIAYAKLSGYPYLAKDKSGAVIAYATKPTKRAECPEWDSGGCYFHVYHDVSFLSWEDEEPYYIGE